MLYRINTFSTEKDFISGLATLLYSLVSLKLLRQHTNLCHPLEIVKPFRALLKNFLGTIS